ncbi:MAG: T9SS type A sorting domain-containing protein [Saprospiraceae bacterium]|nr:T9SS type A sorting domain-containing protein [Saprospiraceae bacterium]
MDRLPQMRAPLEIEAPPDTTINVTMLGCRAMVVLDTASLISFDVNCLPITFMVYIPGVDTLMGNGGKATFQGTGTYDVYYEAEDACQQVDRDTMQVFVIDSIPPTAVCTGTKTVSLDGNGMAILPAFVFDGGSTDSCFLYYKVKRTNPPVGYDCTTPDNPNYMFDDEVKFCCEDVNDTIMVTLRVYDTVPPPGVVSDNTLSGRFSDCMTEVIIRDKAPPVLTCPDDFTIECGEHIDFDTLDLPMVNDNCDSIRFEFRIEQDLDQCGTGEIRRIIIGIDEGGQSDTCTQTIFVENNEPFDGNDPDDLIWPEPFVMIYDCIFVPDTGLAGGPVIRDDECSLVSVSWTDEVYSFSRGACSKVIRNFKVIDWCQYDPRRSSSCNPANGCWTFEQIIKVIDTVPPTIMRPNDTIVDYLQPGCTEMMVDLDTASADTCFFGEQIEFRIEIDFFCDNIIDDTLNSNDASGIYPVGQHKIIYFATDECGNTSVDTMRLEVKDRVLPTPIAMSGISIALVDMGGGVAMSSVWAKDLNASSYDNCTDQEDLIYSFSPDTSDKERVYDCDSVGVQQVRLWVTDECGNQDFVTAIVRVEDTGGFCPDSIRMSSVSGLVQRHDGMKMEDVEIELAEQLAKKMAKTDKEGQYMHDQLERFKDYKLQPRTNDDPLAGITTRDIVVIQRHLLGIEPFSETYQYLGADVDRSGHISTSDLIMIRKLILGRIGQFDHGEEWLFIPSNWKFSNPNDPWSSPWPRSFRISNLTDPEKVNFTSYKIGDVDMSYNLDVNRQRENKPLVLNVSQEGSDIVLRSETERWVSGLQLTCDIIDYQGDDLIIKTSLDNWSNANYRFDRENDQLIISWHSTEAQWIAADEIFRLSPGSNTDSGSAFSVVLREGAYNEVYNDDLSVSAIHLSNSRNDHNDDLINITLSPNPFKDILNIEFFSRDSGPMRLYLNDLLGRQVWSKEYEVREGWNRIVLDQEHIGEAGIYMLRFSTSDLRKEFKIVKSQ